MITPPSKGTPIDLEFIGLLTTEVNKLQSAMDGKSVSISTINGEEKSSFGEIAFFAGSKSFSPGTIDAATWSLGFDFTFPKKFLKTPIVVCSIKNVGGDAGKYITPVLTATSAEGCTGVCVSTTSGNGVSFDVSIFAIGIAG